MSPGKDPKRLLHSLKSMWQEPDFQEDFLARIEAEESVKAYLKSRVKDGD